MKTIRQILAEYRSNDNNYTIKEAEKELLDLFSVSQQRELLIADFIEKYNKGLVGNERIHEDCLEDYLQGNL
jgi:hypothetical protein